ncbi:MAG: hypothetical protein KF820_06330 [Candidatus Paracaedibacteraceae bacterium]|nr:hypothetical protein [Candidatus Paracaedibacteraceae bacterium]
MLKYLGYKKRVLILLMHFSSICSASDSSETTIHLTLTPSDAFLTKNLPPTLASDSSPEIIAQNFIQGTADGLSRYMTASRSLFNQALRGEFNTLNQESILALLHTQLPDIMAHALTSNIDTTTPEQRQFLIIQKIFPIMRQAVYQSLLETGNFGKKREVYVAERQQIETHYKVSVALASTFIHAILPDDFTLKPTLLSLAKHEKVSKYILAKLDKYFAQQSAKLIHKITGDITPETFKNAETLWIIGLSGTPLDHYLLFSRNKLKTLSSKKKEKAFKNVWKYLKPRVNHHIRVAINRTIQGFAKLAAPKISTPIFVAAAHSINNKANGIRLLTTGAGYYAGNMMCPIPFVGGAMIAGGTYWLTSGLLYSAIPNGLSKANTELDKIIAQQIKLFANNYTNSILPLTAEEYALYHLNPKPSALEIYLFSDDYDLKDKLKSEKVIGSFLKDLAHFLKKPVSVLLSKNLPKVPLDMNNIDELDFINTLTKQKSTLPSETQMRLEFYRFAVALDQHQQNLDLFHQSNSYLSQFLSYIRGYQKNPPKLPDKYQSKLNQLTQYPSYAIHQAQLDLASENRETTETEIATLSREYLEEARDVLSKIDKAKQVITCAEDLESLAQSLPYDQYVKTLDQIISTNEKPTISLTVPRRNESLIKTEAQNLFERYQSYLKRNQDSQDKLIDTFAQYGMEAYMLAHFYQEIVRKNPYVFDGRDLNQLNLSDMVLVADRFNNLRLNMVTDSEQKTYIDRNRNELAQFYRSTSFKDNAVWTYSSLIKEYQKKQFKF